MEFTILQPCNSLASPVDVGIRNKHETDRDCRDKWEHTGTKTIVNTLCNASRVIREVRPPVLAPYSSMFEILTPFSVPRTPQVCMGRMLFPTSKLGDSALFSWTPPDDGGQLKKPGNLAKLPSPRRPRPCVRLLRVYARPTTRPLLPVRPAGSSLARPIRPRSPGLPRARILFGGDRK